MSESDRTEAPRTNPAVEIGSQLGGPTSNLRRLFDLLNEGVIVQRLDGTITAINDRAAALYGSPVDKALGMHISDLVDDGDRTKHAAMLELLLPAGRWQGRLVNHDQSGTEIHVDLRIETLRDDQGDISGLVSLATDVSEQVQLEDQLARTLRLESIGELAGGIAHDFNNLLTVILGSADAMQQDLRTAALDGGIEPDRAGDDLDTLVQLILDAAERGSKLTSRLLSFARRQTLRPQLLDLAETLSSMSDLLGRSLTRAITLEIDQEPGLWPAIVDPVPFESALVNLVINARDAMPDGGHVRITTSNAVVTAPREEALGSLTPGDYVRVAVSDTGTGMADEVLRHAADPFFTTKPAGRGTGLGLSSVFGFVRQSGGHLDIWSRPGSGTTVEMWFPRASDGPDPSATEIVHGVGRAAVDAGHGRHALIVDDEPELRRHARRSLERAGYRVTEASDAPEALAVIDAAEAIDVVISDVIMPGGLTGGELIAMLRRTRPEIACLLTSGYADDSLTEGALAVPFLPKPYRGDQLLGALEALFAPPSS